jgi:hypothetical protein
MLISREQIIVPQQPLALHRQQACHACHTTGAVRIEQIIKGDSVLFQWACAACQATWPVVRGDEKSFVERRTGPPERRRKTRHDRRTANR